MPAKPGLAAGLFAVGAALCLTLLLAFNRRMQHNTHVLEDWNQQDFTKYPYNPATFTDGDGPFSTSPPAYGDQKRERRDAKVGDMYSYWWKVPNPSGYPNGELDARHTFPFDRSIGGADYDDFWGGPDRIAQNMGGRSAFYRDVDDARPHGALEREQFERFWGDKSRIGGGRTPEEREYWGRDVDLGSGLSGAHDADPYSDDGLIRVYRKSYSDGMTPFGGGREAYNWLYNNKQWQQKSILPKRGAPNDWPEELYHHDVKHTVHNLETADLDTDDDSYPSVF